MLTLLISAVVLGFALAACEPVDSEFMEEDPMMQEDPMMEEEPMTN
ncbi:MAG: hypothetical protein ACOCVC_01065 [Spirochaeta sp.]